MVIVQQTTGIPGLDEILNGGLPKHTLTLLTGTSGTGKTILSLQWLFDGVKHGENGIYISMTEQLFMAVRNAETMSFYDRKVIEDEKLKILDLRDVFDHHVFKEKQIIDYIEHHVKKTNAKRLVIDSITAILYTIDDRAKIRQFVFNLKKILSTLGCTA